MQNEMYIVVQKLFEKIIGCFYYDPNIFDSYYIKYNSLRVTANKVKGENLCNMILYESSDA